MSLRIHLEGGKNLVMDVSLDDWNKAFSEALRTYSLLEIAMDDEHVIGINPSQVLYLETLPND